MKRKFIWFFIIATFLGIAYFAWTTTEQVRAKKFGGTMTVKVEKGHKFVNVTWKENDLWILSRPIEEGEFISTKPFIFQQKTSFGIKEGKVEIYEQSLD